MSKEGEMEEHIMAMTTTGDEESAIVLARGLLERRIVACVNIVPRVRSLYRWKGTIEVRDPSNAIVGQFSFTVP